jgi:hypothetical protein
MARAGTRTNNPNNQRIPPSRGSPTQIRKVIKRRKYLSRGGGLERLKPPPDSYTAWLGIRFREETDDLEENRDNQA